MSVTSVNSETRSGEVVQNLLFNPSLLWAELVQPDTLIYALALIVPFAFFTTVLAESLTGGGSAVLFALPE